ncbi:hypothetical protein [Pedomonas mirosovicensis]|uniref:hypothetical protein n=1 Tax=Pedomonas mirosovicensis TaxID=2908641 RepID=UPI00216A8A53|nr:hypothetical protein [Pedomonas mirosovicensis]MCH8685930.1 hypothetical protein [Pedomonas mirosovicensis]
MPYNPFLPAPVLSAVAALGLAALSAPAFGQTTEPQQSPAPRPETTVQPATRQPEAAPQAQAAAAQTAASSTEQYQRRIRQAITPDEVRRACAAPNGSLTIGDEIVVCAERDPQQRYRVPGEAVTRPVDPAQDSPVARANRVMKANDDAPVGPGAERGHGALNPFALGKWLKDITEKATEEED